MAVCSVIRAEPPCFADLPEKLQKTQSVAINLGLIDSMEVPTAWQSENNDNPEVRSFLRRRSSWWDCLIRVTIESPVKISPDLAKSLQTTMLIKNMTPLQINALKDLPHFGTSAGDGDSAEVTATARLINGRQMLIVERRGRFNGPCESIGAGRTRMPLLNYMRGTAYLLTDSNSVQPIIFDTDVMGEKPCIEQIRAVLKSIKWKQI